MWKLVHFCLSYRKQAVGGRPLQYAPAPLLPLWASKRLEPADCNIAVGSQGTANTFPRSPLQLPDALTLRLSKAAWWPWPLTLKVVSESRDVGYLCANFGLLIASLFSTWARCTWQTDVRHHHCLIPLPMGRGHKNGLFFLRHGIFKIILLPCFSKNDP